MFKKRFWLEVKTEMVSLPGEDLDIDVVSVEIEVVVRSVSRLDFTSRIPNQLSAMGKIKQVGELLISSPLYKDNEYYPYEPPPLGFGEVVRLVSYYDGANEMDVYIALASGMNDPRNSLEHSRRFDWDKWRYDWESKLEPLKGSYIWNPENEIWEQI